MTHPSSPSPSGLEPSDIEALAAVVVRDVCELPDYSSPEDQPNLIQCTVEELHVIVSGALEAWNRRAPTTSSPISGDGASVDHAALTARVEVLEWEIRAANAGWAVCQQSLKEQAEARVDPKTPLLTQAVVNELRERSEADYALAETREERVAAHGLSLLCDWQDQVRATTNQGGGLADVTGAIDAREVEINAFVRRLDIALNGIEGAAKQAALCDIVSQVENERWKLVLTPATPPPIPPELAELSGRATAGVWQVGRLGDEKLTHVVDMGKPPKAPFATVSEGHPDTSVMRGWPASAIVHSDDGSSEANAAFIAAAANFVRQSLSSPVRTGG